MAGAEVHITTSVSDAVWVCGHVRTLFNEVLTRCCRLLKIEFSYTWRLLLHLWINFSSSSFRSRLLSASYVYILAEAEVPFSYA